MKTAQLAKLKNAHNAFFNKHHVTAVQNKRKADATDCDYNGLRISANETAQWQQFHDEISHCLMNQSALLLTNCDFTGFQNATYNVNECSDDVITYDIQQWFNATDSSFSNILGIIQRMYLANSKVSDSYFIVESSEDSEPDSVAFNTTFTNSVVQLGNHVDMQRCTLNNVTVYGKFNQVFESVFNNVFAAYWMELANVTSTDLSSLHFSSFDYFKPRVAGTFNNATINCDPACAGWDLQVDNYAPVVFKNSRIRANFTDSTIQGGDNAAAPCTWTIDQSTNMSGSIFNYAALNGLCFILNGQTKNFCDFNDAFFKARGIQAEGFYFNSSIGGVPLSELCVINSTSTTSSSTALTTTSGSNAPVPTPAPTASQHSDAGAIAGGVVGALAILACLLAFLYIARKKFMHGREGYNDLGDDNSARNRRFPI